MEILNCTDKDKLGVIVWGDTSPISGRIVTNLSVASYLGQTNQDDSTLLAFEHTQVTFAGLKVHNDISF